MFGLRPGPAAGLKFPLFFFTPLPSCHSLFVYFSFPYFFRLVIFNFPSFVTFSFYLFFQVLLFFCTDCLHFSRVFFFPLCYADTFFLFPFSLIILLNPFSPHQFSFFLHLGSVQTLAPFFLRESNGSVDFSKLFISTRFF